MTRRKMVHADLRSRYTLYLEIGLVVTLGLLVVAFRAPLFRAGAFDVTDVPAERISIDEIPTTTQPDDPPPPPRPQIPVPVPDDQVLDDAPLDLDALIDLSDELPVGPQPGDPVEAEPEPEVFMAVENMPELIGGLPSIMKHITYPEMARRAGVEGTVVVQFTVDVDGVPRDLKILKGLGAGLDEVALESVRQARFRPGLQRARAVPVRMSIPIVFRLK